MGLSSSIHTLLSTLFLGSAWILFQVNAGQISLKNDFNISKPTKEHISWDFFEKPSRDSTSHLIFDTANSFLQHWPNTRYRNGHNIVPGTIPIGTLLHHGSSKEEIPRSAEWTATDLEHSYLFCFSSAEDSGCWHLTLVATRPLRVLYFDGSSAAKWRGGVMDSQDILLWGEVKPNLRWEEYKRLDDLCEWGKQYRIDGFVRMEMDFEVMLCDFTAGVDVVSFHHLVAREHDPTWSSHQQSMTHEKKNIGNSTDSPTKLLSDFRAIEAGSWHNRFPGETRIHLNYAGVVSFYDTALFPSLKTLRSEQERWDHRLKGISSRDVETLFKTLERTLDDAWDRRPSGIDWKTFLRVVVDRYADRLQVLNRLLDPTMLDSDTDAILALKKAHGLISGMLAPYRIYSALPPDVLSIPKFSWAIPVFEACATSHTNSITSNLSLYNLTHSEHLLLDSTKWVSREICRVIVGMWAEGIEHSVSEELFTHSPRKLVTRWKGLTKELMVWLDWSEWVTCQPACRDEEICYLPTWPYFTVGRHFFTDGSAGASIQPHSRLRRFDWPSQSNDSFDDSVKPQPRCIRRMELVPE